MDRMTGTFTPTLTGYTRDMRPWWKRKLGALSRWLAKMTGESNYTVTHSPINYCSIDRTMIDIGEWKSSYKL